MATHPITVTVNRKTHEATVSSRVSLADFLRDQLGYTGTHLACEHGVCGSCTVIVDDRAVRSCLILAAQVDGCTVLTLEGLAESGRLHPIQQALLDNHGFQCGFCTPGVAMSLYELFQRNPNPTDNEVQNYLSGCLCRCTGYGGIRRSVAALRANSTHGEEGNRGQAD